MSQEGVAAIVFVLSAHCLASVPERRLLDLGNSHRRRELARLGKPAKVRCAYFFSFASRYLPRATAIAVKLVGSFFSVGAKVCKVFSASLR